MRRPKNELPPRSTASPPIAIGGHMVLQQSAGATCSEDHEVELRFMISSAMSNTKLEMHRWGSKVEQLKSSVSHLGWKKRSLALWLLCECLLTTWSSRWSTSASRSWLKACSFECLPFCQLHCETSTSLRNCHLSWCDGHLGQTRLAEVVRNWALAIRRSSPQRWRFFV